MPVQVSGCSRHSYRQNRDRRNNCPGHYLPQLWTLLIVVVTTQLPPTSKSTSQSESDQQKKRLISQSWQWVFQCASKPMFVLIGPNSHTHELLLGIIRDDRTIGRMTYSFAWSNRGINKVGNRLVNLDSQFPKVLLIPHILICSNRHVSSSSAKDSWVNDKQRDLLFCLLKSEDLLIDNRLNLVRFNACIHLLELEPWANQNSTDGADIHQGIQEWWLFLSSPAHEPLRNDQLYVPIKEGDSNTSGKAETNLQ